MGERAFSSEITLKKEKELKRKIERVRGKNGGEGKNHILS